MQVISFSSLGGPRNVSHRLRTGFMKTIEAMRFSEKNCISGLSMKGISEYIMCSEKDFLQKVVAALRTKMES